MRLAVIAAAMLLAVPARADQPVLLGAFVGGPGEAGSQGPFDSFSAAVGTPVLLDSYVDLSLPKSRWVESARYAASMQASADWSKSATPVLGLPMASVGQDARQSFKDLASGKDDAMLNGIFQAMVDSGYKGFYLRPGFEMNGSWMPWAVTAANVGDFVAAFQHIAELAHNFKGALIEVVWNPNVGGGAVPWAQMYPGNKFVDIIGVDTYGVPIGGPAPNDPGNPNNITVLGMMRFAETNEKTFALPETGSADVGFVVQLGQAMASLQVPVAFVNVWVVDAACAGCAFSPGSDRAQAWKTAMAAIRATKPPVLSSILARATPAVDPNAAPANPFTPPSQALIAAVQGPVVTSPRLFDLVTGDRLIEQAQAAVLTGAPPAASDALIRQAQAALAASLAQQ